MRSRGRDPMQSRERLLIGTLVLVACALVVPTLAFLGAPATGGWSLGLWAVHGIVYRRARAHRIARGDPHREPSLYARFCVVANFAPIGQVYPSLIVWLLAGIVLGAAEERNQPKGAP